MSGNLRNQRDTHHLSDVHLLSFFCGDSKTTPSQARYKLQHNQMVVQIHTTIDTGSLIIPRRLMEGMLEQHVDVEAQHFQRL